MTLTCTTAVFNAIKAGNRERLVRCVESVAKLKCSHEHLIYDGASTDGTLELLRELEAKTPGLKVVSEPDAGIYNALNKGVRDAKGRWFAVLGCDDYYSHPNVLDEIVNHASSTCKLVIAQVDRDYGYTFFRSRSDFKTIFCGVPCAHMGMLMDVKLIRSFGGFDESLRMGADQDLFFKMLFSGCEFEVQYRTFANFAHGGASAVNECESQENLWEVFRRHLQLTDAQLRLFKCKGYHDPAVMFRYVRHDNFIFRLGSRYMLWVLVRYYLRLVFYPLVWATRPLRRALRK